ncbi:MAG: OmpA family protein [Burkholderiales bacterium]|jgi:OOP family OmpA-OmpF porin|nr:OmpA family protein [Burkholderiales bacterium]
MGGLGGLRRGAWSALALAALALPACDRETPAQRAQKTNDRVQIELAEVRASTPPADALKLLNQIVLPFAPGSVEIPEQAQPVLTAAARAIDRLPKGTRLHVTGHTDDSEEAGLGLSLGLQRAAAVVDFLYANGAPTDKVSAIGVGSQRPLAAEKTEDGRARNRRVEFKIAD